MNFSDDELRKALEENEKDCFSTFRAIGKTVRVDATDAATLITTAVKFWMFNGVFSVRVDSTTAKHTVESWLTHYQAHKLPFGVFLYEHSTSPALELVLQQNGFAKQESTSVVFDADQLDSFHVAPLDPIFRNIAVRDKHEFEAFADCWAQVFNAPSDFQKAFNQWSVNYGFDEHLPLQNIAIMEGERAVAIATYYLDSKVAGIYSVGVHPDYRRRGLGLQIASQIATLARSRGVRYLVGNGSEEGMHVYRKAGIRELGLSQRWIHE